MVPMRLLLLVIISIAEIETQKVSVADETCGLTDCKCCATKSCKPDGVCHDGCTPGYHGGKCRNKCPDNCNTCTDHPDSGVDRPDLNQRAYCRECQVGYYSTDDLYQCQSSCSSGCKSCLSGSNCTSCQSEHFPNVQNPGSCITCPTECSVCDVSSGCSSCIHGYYHSLSQGFGVCVKCPDNCATCESGNECTSCINGWYGLMCEVECSNGCMGSCLKETGNCQCNTNFVGDKCDSCVKGQYGNNCTTSCPKNCQNSECDKLSGNCYACIGNHVLPKCENCSNGYYGMECETDCSKTCLNNTCEQLTGKCNLECVENFKGDMCENCTSGKYGSECDQNCPNNCENTCQKVTGDCDSCKPNFRGETCTQCVDGLYGFNCSMKCPRNCSNGKCIQGNGDCFSCALNQTHGTHCEAECPSNCMYGSCFQSDGLCDSGCKAGYSGVNCTECEIGKYGQTCQNNCSVTCKNKTCERLTGNCVVCINENYLMPKCENCTLGAYGMNCDLNCSSNCNGSDCEKITGTCTSGCIENFSGNTCEECSIGKFGDDCANECPKRCLHNICNKTTGYCPNCSSNFTGNICEECTTGLYGTECSLSCPPNCGDNICDKQSGSCTNKCEVGYSGDKCCLNNSYCDTCSSLLECDRCIDGKHGQTCENNCSSHCKQSSCDKNNGSCNVCMNGFQGPNCVDPIFQHSNQGKKSIAAPIAGTLSGFAVLSLTVVSIVLYRRRRYPGKKENRSRFQTEERIYENEDISDRPARRAVEANATQHVKPERKLYVHNGPTSSIPLMEMKSSTSECLAENNYYNTLEISRKKIQVSQLADHVKSQTSSMFIKEFQKLPKGLLKPCTDARKPENLAKNRYNSIYPYDDDRVKLASPGSDFINACYIDGYKKKREYIASLGPILKATEEFKTFWRMVWQEKTEKIVMVTNLMEKGGMKCEKYWPEVYATKSYGDVIVTCHNEEPFAEYTLRKLTVFKGDEKRPLYHIHYTAWPDKAVPDDVTSLIDFRQKVNSIKSTSNGPTIVHCSAGVGRTGTYIALDILTQEGETEGTVDVFGRVSSMRHQRTHMVQTWEQYEYLHHALVHTLTFDYRPIAAEEFMEFVSTCSDAVMMAKFKRLNSVTENLPESEIKAKQRNKLLKYLNRKDADIPGDIRRPRLYEGKTEGENDYINAVYLNSYRQKDRYILAMTPLPETVTDFLTLLIQEKVSCIVSLDDEHSQLKDEGTYLPADNQTLKIGAFEVKSCRVASNSCYVQRLLEVIMRTRTGAKSQTIHHFQINHWTDGTAVPRDNEKFLQLIREAEKSTDDTNEKGTMVVHCLNAAERSCLFCTTSIMLQKMDTEHEVSVINTLRQVRVRRSLAIPNKEQYVFCHKCICTHLHSADSNLYTNLSMQQ